MFAGVGGFRLGLGERGFDYVWANQWEPSRGQFAADCYRRRFGDILNEDICAVLHRGGVPDFDLLTAGFPCQDYSVARPLSRSHGIEGTKGVLWWSVYEMLGTYLPAIALLENVDRLLLSPKGRRGRDFAIILSCLLRLGYSVAWRVINAADYGMPQRRRRTFILAMQQGEPYDILDAAFPCRQLGPARFPLVDLDPHRVSAEFGGRLSPFGNRGRAHGGEVSSDDVASAYDGPRTTLGDILVSGDTIPERFFIDDDRRWRLLKGGRRIDRVAPNGKAYVYAEGAMPFPDPLDRPSRTLLTSEGSTSASRTTHVVEQDGRLRRLVPVELERLMMFPDGHTDTGMTEAQRAFCCGNALVTGVVERIGERIRA